MTRSLTAALEAETLAGALRPVLFCEIETAAGTSRAWTGYGTIQWNGESWTGLGHLAGVAGIAETGDVQAAGVTLTLSGVPQALLGLVLADVRQGKPVRIWLGAISEAGAVVADPYLVFSGRFDTATVDEGAESATIAVAAESRLIDLERPRARRYTPEDQAIDYPGDKGLDYVASLQDAAVIWGKG
jgi:hypothetical protein